MEGSQQAQPMRAAQSGKVAVSIGQMSTQYECLKNPQSYADAFGAEAPAAVLGEHVWPRQQGFFIRKGAPCAPDSQAHGAAVQLCQGQFGLVPAWVKSASDAKLRATKLAVIRHETMSTARPTYDAWMQGQRCIIAMQAFWVDDWRSGRAVPTRIARVDGKPMGVAGLWCAWSKEGQDITSFALLTVNANSHELMNRYQQAGSEKRMPAILNEGAYTAWLDAPVDKARAFMRAYPAQSLLANPVQR